LVTGFNSIDMKA